MPYQDYLVARKGHVGVVTTLFPVSGIKPSQAVAFVCGPDLMIKSVIQDLVKMSVPKQEIFVSIERNMKCGGGHLRPLSARPELHLQRRTCLRLPTD